LVKDKSLEQIESSAYFAFRESQSRLLIGNKREAGYHVTDLCKPCMRNVFYSKQAEASSTVQTMDTSAMAYLYMGNAIHAVSDLKGKLHEFKMFYHIEEDKGLDQAEYLQMSTEDKWKVLVGTVDDVIESNGQLVVIDKKTWVSKGFKLTAPKDHHVLQCNIYRMMLQKCAGLDPVVGCILYLDIGDRIEKPLPLGFNMQDTKLTRADVVSKWNLLEEARKNKTVPARVKNWMCDGYCAHAMRCFTQGDELVEKIS